LLLHQFECNYGSPFSAFIDQYFGTFRERLGKSAQYTGECNDKEADKLIKQEATKGKVG
jgi:sterol desaturase/sphingolipid hydroxylase (fatty acid hydroxylase superfamily)